MIFLLFILFFKSFENEEVLPVGYLCKYGAVETINSEIKLEWKFLWIRKDFAIWRHCRLIKIMTISFLVFSFFKAKFEQTSSLHQKTKKFINKKWYAWSFKTTEGEKMQLDSICYLLLKIVFSLSLSVNSTVIYFPSFSYETSLRLQL